MARIAAVALLALAATAAGLAAARLVAVGVGSGFSPADDLPWPDGCGERAALAAFGAILVVALLVLLFRDDPPRLWLAGRAGAPGEGLAGGVLLPASALEEAAEAAVAGHLDVLRATATASGDERRLRLIMRVAARPLVDADDVGAELARRAEEAVRPLLGARELEVRARVRGVRVGSLPRYLP